MSEPKPFASLGPLLLARKGGASPAPLEEPDSSQDGSLGESREGGSEIADQGGWYDCPALRAEPKVKRQQRELVSRIAHTKKAAPMAGELRKPPDSDRRVAFTLRLGAERHLKLKLASAIYQSSAQQLAVQALDRFLAEMPEIETLAGQVKRSGNKG